MQSYYHGGVQGFAELRRTLLLPPKNLLSVSSAFFAVGDQGRAEFTQGPRAAWLGCLCSPIAPEPLGSAFSSSPRFLRPSPTRSRPRVAPAADPAGTAGAAAEPAGKRRGRAAVLSAAGRVGGSAHGPPFPSLQRNAEPKTGKKRQFGG